jgi:hypothetical protein
MQQLPHRVPLCIFEHCKDSTLRSRGVKQRRVIKLLDTLQVADVTRGVLAKHLAAELGISRANAYQYAYKELEECLIPNGIVEETGATILPTRGPGLLQNAGIPCYRLTSLGMLIACTLEELGIEKQKELLKRYLACSKVSGAAEFAVNEWLESTLRKHPEYAIELAGYCVRDFVHGRSAHPLDAIMNDNNILANDW